MVSEQLIPANVMNQPLILLSNMANMMTVRLDNTNYIVWKHQITMILETYLMFELLEEPHLILEKYLTDLSGSFITILNLDYSNWRSKEKALLTFMSSTLSPTILALTIGCSIAMEVWKVLENRFSTFSRSHVMNLKGELHNIKKGSYFVDLYLQKIKVIRDKLLAVGVIVDGEESLHIAIKGLPKDYNAFRLAIRTRSTQLSFNELATMLNVEEESLNEGLEVKNPIFAMAFASNSRPNTNNGFNQYFSQSYSNRGRGRDNYNNRGGRGGKGSNNSSNQFNQFSPNQSNNTRSERRTCQICGKLGHLAIDCYHRMNYAYQGKHLPTKLVVMAIASNACWHKNSLGLQIVVNSDL